MEKTITAGVIDLRQETKNGPMDIEILCLRKKMIKFRGKYGGYIR